MVLQLATLGAGAAGGDVVPIGVTVVATLTVVALLAGIVALVRQARALRHQADLLAVEASRLLGEMEQTLDVADAHLGRVDDLIGSAESISEAVGSASRLASTAMAGPVIKAMAFGTGAAPRRAPPAPGPALGEVAVFKRVRWMGMGAVAGLGASAWAQRKVRRTLEQHPTIRTTAEGAALARRIGREVRAAVSDGRQAMSDREAALRSTLEGHQPPAARLLPPVPGTAAAGRALGRTARGAAGTASNGELPGRPALHIVDATSGPPTTGPPRSPATSSRHPALGDGDPPAPAGGTGRPPAQGPTRRRRGSRPEAR